MRCLIATLLLILPLALQAQSTEDALKLRLVHKPLYLQHSWGGDKLHFDGAGGIVGTVSLVSFTLCGLEVDSVKLKGNELQLTAHRVGLEFFNKVPTRVPLQVRAGLGFSTKNEEMKLTIDAPAGTNYGPALDAMFTDKLADLVPRMPVEWQSFAKANLLDDPSPEPVKPPAAHGSRREGEGMTAPRVVFAPEPQYSEAARVLRRSGTVLVYLQVDKAGLPVQIRILKPIGLGLDEAAVASVRAYKFEPAKENGEPVVVEMNVDVNFQIF